MTENSDPSENAQAERVNGILKEEFLLNTIFKTHKEALIAVDSAIDSYNKKRPHSSCDYLTPAQAHCREGVLKKRWKDYRKKNQYETEGQLSTY